MRTGSPIFMSSETRDIHWKYPTLLSVTKKKVEAAHKMGLKICLRAADSVGALEHMKKLGLDYFPTNKMHDR